MIDPDKRKAIYLLHQEGMSAREIGRRLGLSRNTVREVIGQQGQVVPVVRKDKQAIDPELLRSARERSFWTVETNFLPGRRLRMEQRPQTKSALIPAKAFEHERTFLIELPPHLPAPYQAHERGTDQYGYITFDANFYWVPGTARDDVKVLQYADRLKIYKDRACLIEYALPADGVRNQWFSPQGLPLPPHEPQARRQPTQEEEKRLRAIAPSVSTYLDWVLERKGLGRHRFLRSLLALSRKMSPELFVQSVERAAKYRIEELHTLERIAWLYLQQGAEVLPVAPVDEQFTQREAYLEGSLTEAPDLSIYQDPPQDDPPPPSSGHE